MREDKALPIVPVEPVPFTANYAWSVGVMMEKFIKSLADKKLFAAKCPNCGYTYVPPRNRCGKCGAKIEENDMVELSGKGRLLSSTDASLDLDGSGNFVELDTPRIICAVVFEGADSTLFLPLVDGGDDVLLSGTEMDIVWNKETTGSIKDIAGVKQA